MRARIGEAAASGSVGGSVEVEPVEYLTIQTPRPPPNTRRHVFLSCARASPGGSGSGFRTWRTRGSATCTRTWRRCCRPTPPHVAGGREVAASRARGGAARARALRLHVRGGGGLRVRAAPDGVGEGQGLPAVAGAGVRPGGRVGARAARAAGDRGRDGSFVWAGAADLTPLRDDFPRLAGVGLRSNCKVEFALALDGALAEVARRVDAGLSCGCGGAAAKGQVFQNSGLRRGASVAAVDACFARDALRGDAFLRYVGALAVAPGDGADRLDHAVAAAQLEAFKRWRRKNALVFAERAARAATPKRTARARGQDDGAIDSMVLSATPRARRATTPKRTRTAGQDDGVAGVVGSSMVFSAANRTMTRCARAAVAAAEDAAFMRKVFRGDASVDYYASAKGLTPQAGTELALATPQPRAFAQWSAASPTFVPDEHTDTHDDTTEAAMDAAAKMMTESTGGEDSTGDPGRWRMTSCISSKEENSGSEDDGDDDDAMESDCSSEAPPHETMVSSSRWKDRVIVLQLMVIALLVYRLMMQ
ncbi:hypothetical protein ZWY2020_041106 [Hordeum vulgare]|nr:hypothetical protein ZWY2020_041106 [Hordeum vulgare]